MNLRGHNVIVAYHIPLLNTGLRFGLAADDAPSADTAALSSSTHTDTCQFNGHPCR